MKIYPEVAAGQLYLDRAPDMINRQRRLRVVSVNTEYAGLVVEHDLDGQIGRMSRIAVRRLHSTAFELLEDGPDTDPLYLLLLDAISRTHGPNASAVDYARAAFMAVRGGGETDQ